MVKRSRLPGRGVVTGLASLRQPPGYVIRRFRSLIFIQMAGDAGRDRDVVIIVDVTVGARQRRRHVRTSQIEAGGRVIKLGGLPCGGVMAKLAGLRE